VSLSEIRVMLVDDEPLMCEELQCQLEAYPEVEVVAVCHEGEEALARAGELKPALIFLDVQMPGIDGLKVAEVLSRHRNPPTVVFVTAHDEYAVKAFAVDASDYVLKPFDEENIRRVMSKLKKKLAVPTQATEADLPHPEQFMRKFCVQRGGKLEVMDQEQIQLIYAKERAVFIQTEGASHLIKSTLNELATKLDPKFFLRCHRNYIVNVDQIQSLENWFNRGYLLVLRDGRKTQVPVSRQYVRSLKNYLEF